MDTDIETPFFNKTVQLTGTDGNAMAIIAKVRSALRDVGATEAQLAAFTNKAMDGTYQELLVECGRWVHVV